MGLKFSIATDTHSTAGFSTMRFGIDQARRGWLEAEDVINSYTLKKLKKYLSR